MTDAYVTVNGKPAHWGLLFAPYAGAWFLDVDIEGDEVLAGRVRAKFGTLELEGTIDPGFNGTHGIRRRCRVVGGAGKWGGAVAPFAYHNDAGVKARHVAEDAARAVGETLGTFSPARERLGSDYVRRAGAASTVLEDCTGVTWWVSYDGLTNVGAREDVTPSADAYAVLNYEPRTRKVMLSIDDLSKVGVGTILTEGLDEPQIVRDLEIEAKADGLVVTAWCGDVTRYGRGLPALFRQMVEKVTDDRLYGKYRYRVLAMASGGKANLQVVNPRPTVPDLLPVSQWSSPGIHAELTEGAEVLVEFIEGMRNDPIVTQGAPRDGVGHVPKALELAGGKRDAAAVGDTVTVVFPAVVPFTAVLGVTPITGTLNMVATKAVGIIDPGGNRRVKIP